MNSEIVFKHENNTIILVNPYLIYFDSFLTCSSYFSFIIILPTY
jgi:hypothetical protein